jgi:hypothetical protein
MRVLVVLFLFLLSAAAAQAQPRTPLYGEPSDFFGTWHNVEVDKNQVIRIEIKPYRPGFVRVVVYGLRNGEPCQLGQYRGRLYLAKYQRPREEDNSAVHVKVDREFVSGDVLISFNRRGEIVTRALLSYPDRGNIYSVERFAPIHASYRDDYEDSNRRDYGDRRPYWRGY